MLKSLKVEMLVLSAIPDLVDTWTSVFGFEPIEDDEKKRLHNISFMTFPGTVLLKKILGQDTAKKSGLHFYLLKTLSSRASLPNSHVYFL